MLRRDVAAVALILVIGALIVTVVGINGDFAQNDDVGYAPSVTVLVEEGRLDFGFWVATNFLSNILWGALFAVLFGADFESLRLSTLVASGVGLLSIYGSARVAGAMVSTALLASLCAMAAPLYMWMSFGFMTDVPFMAAEAVSIFFLLLYLKTNLWRDAAIGWAVAVVALLSRQTALAIPLAFGAAVLAARPRGRRAWIEAMVPILGFVALQLGFERWLTASGNMSENFGAQFKGIAYLVTAPDKNFARVVDFGRQAFLYLGLFFLPVNLAITARWLSSLSRGRSTGLLLLLAGASAVSFYMLDGQRMPVWWNTWGVNGFSPGAEGIPTPQWVLLALTIASCIGGSLGVLTLIRALAVRSAVAVFASAGFILSCGAIFVAYPAWDRYLIALFPWLAVIFAVVDPGPGVRAVRGVAAIAVALVAAMGLFSFGLLYNTMSERRVAVTLVDRLVSTGINRETINAGWVLDSASTSRVADWDNLRNQSVEFFVTQVGKAGADMELVGTHPVHRILLWGAPSPDEAIYRRR